MRHPEESKASVTADSGKTKVHEAGIAKTQNSAKEKARNEKVQQAIRSGLDRLSKDEFLTALLTGDKKPERTSKEGHELTNPPRDGQQPVIIAPSAQSSSKSRKRQSTFSEKTSNSGTKKQRRHTATPDEEPAQPISPDTSDNDTHPLAGPTLKLRSSNAFHISKPTQPAAADISAETASSPQKTFSSLSSTCSKSNAAPDAARREAIALNYAKSIGHTERRRNDRPIEDVMRDKGQFTIEELDKAYSLRKRWCEEHKMTESRFDSLLHESSRSNALAKELWKEFYELYPYRKVHTLNKILRRHFHPYGRSIGWTKDEDQELLRLVQTLGKKWKDIGFRIDRRPEDARTRWRNYLQYDNRKQERWDPSEMVALGTAIGDLMYKVLIDRREETTRQGSGKIIQLSNEEYRKLINWEAVAKLVPGRTRLQCLQEWMYLEDKAQATYQHEVGLAEMRATNSGSHMQPQSTRTKPQMLAGDKLLLCKAIAACQATSDTYLDWKEIKSCNTKLEVFSRKLLRRTWAQLRSEHLSESEQANEDLDESNGANLVRRRLKKATPKDAWKDHWSKRSVTDNATPPQSSVHDWAAGRQAKLDKAAERRTEKEEKERIAAKAFKSSEYIDESDMDMDQ